MIAGGRSPDPVAVRRVYDHVASKYRHAAEVAREIERRLHTRLAYLDIAPTRILDIGSGTGDYLRVLQKRYPRADVMGVDLSWGMLQQSEPRRWWQKRAILVQSDAKALPFADGSFDLITSNLMLFFAPDIKAVFAEVNRVLAPGGALLFSTLGPQSFQSLSAVLRGSEPDVDYIDFPDMHDVGDAMVAAGLAQPVLDSDAITLQYSTVPAMLEEVIACGGLNLARARRRGLTSPSRRETLQAAFVRQGVRSIDLEVVQGHAWKGAPRSSAGVPASTLPERYIPLKKMLSK